MSPRLESKPPTPQLVSRARARALLPFRVAIGFFVAALAVAMMAFFSYQTHRARTVSAVASTHAFEVMQAATDVLSTLKDAETGQRGFLLTGLEHYLAPYEVARAEVWPRLDELERLVADNPSQIERAAVLRALATQKLEELGETVELRRRGDSSGALAIVATDRGRAAMERVRTLSAEILRTEHGLLAERRAAWASAAEASLAVTFGGSAVLFALIIAAAILVSRDYRAGQFELWLRRNQLLLVERLQGDGDLSVIAKTSLDFLAETLGARVGALFVPGANKNFVRVATYALAEDASLPRVIDAGDGVAGAALKDKRIVHLEQVPAEHLRIDSVLGRSSPREIVIAPFIVDGVVQALVEFGFVEGVHRPSLAFLERVGESVAVLVRRAQDEERVRNLLDETQRQAEELQAQQEELLANNAELEEQGRVLASTHASLEVQQDELERTNARLADQSAQLAHQKEELLRAQEILARRAVELERSNQYKSEFLANMSHELRTPLNSSLILAKLLADNREGNLSAEQVKFAETISNAGNDLLVLINDILDLAKIESGNTELVIESLHLAGALEAAVASLTPQAANKGLPLELSIEPGVPERIESDERRFGQILKNLLSNAVKFTESGKIEIQATAEDGERIVVRVKDTGIGIPAEQQEMIFEAFRQADGSTHRKYGGTGLGLSISRDLARLLGGELTVTSTPGVGSTFALSLPYRARPREVGKFSRDLLRPEPLPQTTLAEAPSVGFLVEDDRDKTLRDGRVIVVIEDDDTFAGILRDLARELDFDCIVAGSASSGLAAVRRYRPSAVILDVNLPDHSGLGVLDQLKRLGDTRHIPVHVVSVADYSRLALHLGAVGYALKPVRREELVEAFRNLERKSTRDLRRILVVEDDERQRESLELLLRADGVEIVSVESAGEAVARLENDTYDCLVMDLHLPDVSGYELLERLAALGRDDLPPVIVYTGRNITIEEEQRLRRHSKSIILKDAHSPERLLDEVTLFLHQVEALLPPESQRLLREARSREATFEGRRVLLVEDDVRNIFALSKVLEPKGVIVEIARSGREALRVLEQSLKANAKGFDMVLMDIMMPEMDGLTATREIRRKSEFVKLPIIALTAKAMSDDRDRCLEAGANDYIAKPLDAEKLLSLMRVWMPVLS